MILRAVKSGKGGNIMISIVLPTYNGEKYLEQSINSIIGQTYEDWELIIVNDCSRDNTVKIAQSFVDKDKRVKIINNAVNKKLPASLNIGFSAAKGDYFTWTSDDNAYANNALEVMLKNITEQKVDFVFADYHVIDEEDYVLYKQVTGPVEQLPLYDNIGACFLYKREIQEILHGYNPDKFLVEDYDFWLRVYWKYNMYHIAESLYFYRMHAQSLTVEREKEVRLAEIKLLKENIQFIKDEELKKKVNLKIQNFYEKRKQV